MAESNRVRVGYIEETGGWGVTPTTGVLQTVRRTGGNFSQETDTIESSEVRSDRAVADIVRNQIRGTGNIDFEASLGGSHDTFFASAAFNDWTTQLSTVIDSNNTVSFTASSSTIAGTGLFTNIPVGS